MVALMVSLALAVAAVPDTVVPAAGPADVQARFDGWNVRQDRALATLACGPLFGDHGRLCYRVGEPGSRRWVTLDDLSSWGESLDSLQAEIRARAARQLVGRLEPVTIDGMGATYWVSKATDGWTLSPLLHPPSAEQVGRPLLAAVPADGVVLLWTGGRADVDKVIAVGARELYDSRSRPVTPVVHQWDGARWIPFARAVARPE